MADKTPEEYEARIAQLQAELDRMRAGSVFALTGTLSIAPSTGGATVLGVEEMILQIGEDDTIGYVNAPMAGLLGMPNRKLALGDTLDLWDRGPIGEGVLAALVQVARSAGRQHVLERPCPGVTEELLPPSRGARPTGDPILLFVANAVRGRVTIVVQDVTQLRWLEQTFSRYVPPAVIEKMQGMLTEEFLSMERREVTLLFGDLRGFTALCQQLRPEEVQEMVNGFLANMVHCVSRLEGTVDKFVGDEVMAIFGAPMRQPDHALRALICAARMQHVHTEWMTRREQEGKPARALGIGVATGEVVVGNIGAQARMDYTALGHTVNMAARLCGSAGGGEVLTLHETHAAAAASLQGYHGEIAVPRFSFRSKGKMNFKNVDEPVEVVSVLVGAKEEG